MNNKPCVVVADAARARVYLLEPHRGQGGAKTSALVEQLDLFNAGRRQLASATFSDSRPGSNRARANGGSSHGFDDHRDAHIDETDRKFAADVVAEAKRIATESSCERILLAAPPRMLGYLREYHGALSQAGYEVVELPRDLSKLTSAELGKHPAVEGALAS